jgi:signal peptidase II
MRALARTARFTMMLFGCVGCDQVSKSLARAYRSGSGVHTDLGDVVRLQYVRNPAAFLSLGANLSPALRYRGFVIAVGARVAARLAWALLSRRVSWGQRLAVTTLGAGGVGNLIDRIRFDGTLTDFLSLGFGPVRTGIFNVADAIMVLAVMALAFSFNAQTRQAGTKP